MQLCYSPTQTQYTVALCYLGICSTFLPGLARPLPPGPLPAPASPPQGCIPYRPSPCDVQKQLCTTCAFLTFLFSAQNTSPYHVSHSHLLQLANSSVSSRALAEKSVNRCMLSVYQACCLVLLGQCLQKASQPPCCSPHPCALCSLCAAACKP